MSSIPVSQIADRAINRLHEAILEWYALRQRDLPWRLTRDPYHILVAEVMLQQTQVDRVVPKYQAFLTAFPTLEYLAAAPTADVIRVWAPLGYNRRAVNLQAAAREVVSRFGGNLPNSPDLLETLPGVGRYTARAIACFAFEQPVPVVDTNIRRILSRIFGDIQPVPNGRIWDLAARALPSGQRAYRWNQALMDLGATVCLSRAPLCHACPAFDLCSTRGHGESVELMAAEPRSIYRTTPFKGSTRYYRGRALDALRELSTGDWLTLEELAARLKPNSSPSHREWIESLTAGLVRDGLANVENERISLP